MSKRLRFAKLRLGKPIEPGEPAPVAVPAEANVCVDSTANGKTSKYFAKPGTDVCAEEDTFIVIHSEESGEENEVSPEQSSRRRTQNPPEACPNDGPKLPKLRKKTAEGNALISNFLASQPSQKAEGDDDFEEAKVGSPKLQPKKTKVQRAATKKPVKAQRRPKNQADIRKVFKKYKNDHEVLQELLKEHSAAERIDPEQLQIALAMSRSLADQECSNHPTTSASFDGEEAQMASSSGTSEERRIVSIRTTLEQFGFRCKNSYTDYDLNVIFGSGSVTKNVKKIKHKRATNLQPRSREELAAFIDGQAKKLFPLEMMQNAAELATPLDLESRLTSLFWIAQTELPSEQLMEMYYVPELLEANPAPVGCMLKDWSKIPGRECTPERELDGSAGLAEAVDVERGNEGLTGDADAVGESSVRMSSPDLFDDSEIDTNLSERKENRLALEESTEKAECENEANNEQQEEQSQASLNETGKALDDHEESRAFEEASASDNVEVVEENCIEAAECNSNEQAMENVASTSCVADRSVTEQEEVIVLDDNSEEEEDKFVTAPEMSECPQPVFHQSSENIFEDTDPNPMVSFETYSSEEEKISAASRTAVGTVSANGDIGPVDQVPNAVAREDDGTCNTLDREGDCGHESEQKSEDISSVSKTVENNISSSAKEPRFSAEKDLSFTRLAIKARLSEVSSVETVDLLDSAPSNGNPTQNLEELDMESVVGTQCSQQNDTQDDVLYISDDEVNYSIRGEPSRVRETQPEDEEAGGSDPEEDPDMTVAYTVPGPTEQCENRESHLSLNSNRPPCLEMEPEILTISSTENDSEPIVGEVIGAENTFAYLGNLVKEFNLPPLKSQQNGTLDASKSTSSICSNSNGKEFDDGSQHLPIEIDDDTDEKEPQSGTNPVVQQDVSVIRNNVPEVPDELENYLNNYEEPNFDDHEIEAEMIASQYPRVEHSVPEVRMPSAKALSRVKSCTQFDSPRVASPLRRTPSEAVLLSSSTPKEKAALGQQQQQPCGGDRFESKFSDLKKAVIDVGPVEYVISTVNVSQQPPEYESMSTPEIERELFKYGLKSLQRHKAVRVLNYLFETMHPYVMIEERKEDANLQLGELESIPTASQGVRKKCKPIAPAGSSTVLKRPRKCAFQLDTTTTDYFLPSKPRKKVS
ncbi:AGAP007582-PA [Anopheles gambiae str. PEST]|uniref:AGAP007582-PA n=1 Tax=Anopheles gambiae TaxID=7165 RepID=A7UR94_ANOGA|nr:AGAP007582-PA [Anopheles gambiae str. PEST]